MDGFPRLDGDSPGVPWLTRRETLSSLGVAGLLGLGGTHVSTADHSSLDREDLTWTARHRQRIAQYAADGATGDSENAVIAGEKFASLEYLGASWSPFANPAPGSSDERGAWRHTFLVSNFVAMQTANEMTPAGYGSFSLPSENPSYDFDDTFSAIPKLEVAATGDEDDDPPRQPDIAVSAIRDEDLFGFVHPDEFVDGVENLDSEDGVEAGEVQTFIDGIATANGEANTNFNDILVKARRAEEAAENRAAVLDLLLLGVAATGPAGAAAVGVVELGSMLLDALLDPSRDEEPVAYNDGFEQEFPEPAAGPVGSGFVMFDVYVAPGAGQSGRVDVSTSTHLETESYGIDSDVGDFESTWTVEVGGLPAPDPNADGPPAAAFTAEIEDFQSTAPVQRDSSEHSGTYALVNDSPAHDPEPVITPPDEIASSEDGTLTPGDTYTFSARRTLRAGARIDPDGADLDSDDSEYVWSIEDPGADAGAYDDVEGDFEIDLEVEETDSRYIAVELEVTDADGNTGTTSQDYPVGDGHAAIDPQIDVVEPEDEDDIVVGDAVTVSAAGSSAEAGVSSYSWAITSFPAEFPEHAERYHSAGTGEQFDVPTLVSGTYEVYLQVTDGLEHTDSTTRTVVVEDADPTAEIVFPSHDIVPKGERVTLRVDDTGFAGGIAEAEVTWRVDGETLEQTGTAVPYTFEQDDESVVYIEVSVVGIDGEQEATDDLLVTVEDQSGPMFVDVKGVQRPPLDQEFTYRADVEGSHRDRDYRWSVTVPGEDAELPDDSGFKAYEPPRQSGLNDNRTISGEFVEEGDRRFEVTVVDEDGNSATDAAVIPAGSMLDVDIEAPSTVRPDAPVTFTADVQNAHYDYNVVWSGAVSGTGEELTTKISDIGYDDVEVEVTEIDSNGQQATDSVSLFVDDYEEVSIELVDAEEPVEPDTEVKLRASISGFENSPDYRWHVPDAADFDLSSRSGMIHSQEIDGTFGVEGMREVSVTAADSQDGDSASDTREIDVDDPLEVDLVADQTSVWTGDTVNFEAQVSGADGEPTYEWTNVDGSGSEVSWSWSEGGRHYVEVTVDDGEETAKSGLRIDVEAVEIEIQEPIVDVKENSTIRLEAEVSNARGSPDYDWHVEDGDFDLSPYSGFNDPREIEGEFTDHGTKEVSVTAQDDDNNVGSDSIDIDVDEVEPIDVDLSASDGQVETGESVDFTASLSNTSGPPDITWIGVRGSGTTASESWSCPGSKDVTVDVDDGETSDSDSVSVDVVAPDPELEIDYTTMAGTGSYDFEAVTSYDVDPDTYDWYVDGDHLASGEETSTYLSDGEHTVRLEITYACGESASTEQDLTVYTSY